MCVVTRVITALLCTACVLLVIAVLWFEYGVVPPPHHRHHGGGHHPASPPQASSLLQRGENLYARVQRAGHGVAEIRDALEGSSGSVVQPHRKPRHTTPLPPSHVTDGESLERRR